MKDGAKAHTCRAAMQWMDTVIGVENMISGEIKEMKGRTYTTWPARSPDFNPLDLSIWATLKRRALAANPRGYFVNRNELKQQLQATWAEITQEEINKACVESFKRQLGKCLAVDGKTTKDFNAALHTIPEF